MPDETPTQVADRVAAEAAARIAERAAGGSIALAAEDRALKAEAALAELKATIAARDLTGEKEKLIAANPDIPAGLITGDTAAALAASVASAKAIADQVRQQLAATTDIPAGGGTPPAVDPFSLPPNERIAYGLAHPEIQRTNIGAHDKGERAPAKEKEKKKGA
jgi:hypothetical protein